MYKNVASQKIAFFAFDVTTGLPKTGDAANLTGYVDIDWGGVTVLADTTATEIDSTNAKGWYSFDLAQAESNGNTLVFSGKSSTANIVLVGVQIQTFPSAFGLVAGAANGLFIAGANAATSIATALTANIVGNITGALSGAVGSVTAAVSITAAAVQAIWDALTSALTTSGSIGKWILDKLDVVVSTRTKPADTQARVALVDVLTAYTGNTPQTGDAYAVVNSGTFGLAAIKTLIDAIIVLDTAIDAKTTNLPSDPADESLIIAATNAILNLIGVAGAGLTALGDSRIANLDATMSSRATPAQVNTQVDAVINVAAKAELTGVPAANASLGDKIAFIQMKIRNEEVQDGSTQTITDSSGATIGTAPTSDAAGTFTKGKYV